MLVALEAAKLPAMWADAVDVTKPVPPGVHFFERKIVAGDFLTAIAGGLVCAVLGVICVPLGAYMLWTERGDRSNAGSSTSWWVMSFGFAALVAAWMCATSLVSNWRTMRKQDHGQPTRLRMFVAPGELLLATEHAFTLVPRERFVGIAGDEVKYTQHNQTRSIRLPRNLVRDDANTMRAAIEAWAATG